MTPRGSCQRRVASIALESASIARRRITSIRQLISAPGEGLSVENPAGGILTFKITSDVSGGSLTALETIAAPGEGPPLHMHDEDELIYTLDGTFRIMLGDTLRELPPRSFVFIPRGTRHTWQNVGAREGHRSIHPLAAETTALRVVGPPLLESSL
jgi:quercetin dioxygenase-like cupin family protein